MSGVAPFSSLCEVYGQIHVLSHTSVERTLWKPKQGVG